jgi:hypothetical protein
MYISAKLHRDLAAGQYPVSLLEEGQFHLCDFFELLSQRLKTFLRADVNDKGIYKVTITLNRLAELDYINIEKLATDNVPGFVVGKFL